VCVRPGRTRTSTGRLSLLCVSTLAVGPENRTSAPPSWLLALSHRSVLCLALAQGRQQHAVLVVRERYVDTMTVACSPQPALTATNLQDAEQRLYRLPPLEGLLLQWQAARSPVACAESRSLLLQREQELGPMTLPATSIELLAALALDCLSRHAVQQHGSAWAARPLSARIVRHAASFSAGETQALLPPHVLVQKTVSVTLDGTCLLCTGAGTSRLTRDHLRRMGRSLALSSHAVSHATINAPSCSPVEMFGMQAGMVSSFLPPARQTGLAALVLLPDLPTWQEEQEQEQAWEIAISLSLWESLLLPLLYFRPLVEAYSRRACPTVPFVALESEKQPHEPDVAYGSHDTTAPATAVRRTAAA
jgi:hypothetical protein